VKDFFIGNAHESRSIEFSDFVAAAQDKIEAKDPASLLKLVPYLRRLGNNRSFLAALVREQVEGQKKQGVFAGQSPTWLLWNDRHFMIRAVVWDQNSDDHALDHNHNFDFLTLGYYGPGYCQNIFEFDGHQELFPGKPVAIEHVGQDTLAQGQIRYFDSKRIIHSFPRKNAFSISINVIHKNEKPEEQYSFDVQRGLVTAVLDPHFDKILVEMLGQIADERDMSWLQNLAQQLPTPYSRLSAIDALARFDREAWKNFEKDRAELVRREARRHLLSHSY
jgi:hypothetical protein